MIKNAFPKVLKRLREEKHLTQQQLAFESGLHRTYISQLERGIKSPSLDTLQKLSEALEIRLSELIIQIEKIK
ncbi:helix-turn-helix domain-containing protein [bacterium]|nr:helix-turn-helix domain-containing protein [bacterium]